MFLPGIFNEYMNDEVKEEENEIVSRVPPRKEHGEGRYLIREFSMVSLVTGPPPMEKQKSVVFPTLPEHPKTPKTSFWGK